MMFKKSLVAAACCFAVSAANAALPVVQKNAISVDISGTITPDNNPVADTCSIVDPTSNATPNSLPFDLGADPKTLKTAATTTLQFQCQDASGQTVSNDHHHVQVWVDGTQQDGTGRNSSTQMAVVKYFVDAGPAGGIIPQAFQAVQVNFYVNGTVLHSQSEPGIGNGENINLTAIGFGMDECKIDFTSQDTDQYSSCGQYMSDYANPSSENFGNDPRARGSQGPSIAGGRYVSYMAIPAEIVDQLANNGVSVPAIGQAQLVFVPMD